jgi:hypothetical protein
MRDGEDGKRKQEQGKTAMAHDFQYIEGVKRGLQREKIVCAGGFDDD